MKKNSIIENAFEALPVKSKRKFVPPTLNYQLGSYVGEFILNNILPTISTDMLKTRNVVQIDPEDKIEHDRLDQLYDDSKPAIHKTGDSRLFQDRVKFDYDLNHKYLPKILKCRVPAVFPTKISEFKQGIIEVLWDSDLCSYDCATGSDVAIIDTNEGSWMTEINLTLSEYRSPFKK